MNVWALFSIGLFAFWGVFSSISFYINSLLFTLLFSHLADTFIQSG